MSVFPKICIWWTDDAGGLDTKVWSEHMDVSLRSTRQNVWKIPKEPEHHQAGTHLTFIVYEGNTATKCICLILLPGFIHIYIYILTPPPKKKTDLQILKNIMFAFNMLQGLGEARMKTLPPCEISLWGCCHWLAPDMVPNQGPDPLPLCPLNHSGVISQYLRVHTHHCCVHTSPLRSKDFSTAF